jgi:alpha-1,3-rhamnosyl/mannosyltransferase
MLFPRSKYHVFSSAIPPLVLPCPSVVTIHDLNWYYHPESFKPAVKFIVEWMVRISAATASHIITDSVSSADSISSVLKLDDKQVTPILHGAPRTIALTPSNIRASLTKYGVNKPYLFTVVSGLPHKNLHSLIHAFQILHESFPKLNLVVCGLGGLSAQSNKKLIKK